MKQAVIVISCDVCNSANQFLLKLSVELNSSNFYLWIKWSGKIIKRAVETY